MFLLMLSRGKEASLFPFWSLPSLRGVFSLPVLCLPDCLVPTGGLGADDKEGVAERSTEGKVPGSLSTNPTSVSVPSFCPLAVYPPSLSSTVEQTELPWLLASSGRGGSFMTAVVSAHHQAAYPPFYSSPPPTLHKSNSQQKFGRLDARPGDDGQGEEHEPLDKLWLLRQPSEETAVSDEDSLYGDDHGSQLSQSPSSSLGSSPGSDVSCAVVDKRVVARTKTAQDIRLRFASKLGIPNPKRRSPEETAARRLSCLPEGYEPVFEKLKGHVESYGGFLRLMRRSNSMVHEPTVTASTNPPNPSSSSSPADASCKPLHSSTNVCNGADTASSSQSSGARSCSNINSSNSLTSPCSGVYCTPTKKLVGGLRKKPVRSSEDGGGAVNRSPVQKKVNFSEAVRVVRIPRHADYSRRVREQYWSTAEDIYEMACRNLVEFDMEGHDWENVAEEHQMVWCEEAGELIHPAHFEVYEEAPEEHFM